MTLFGILVVILCYVVISTFLSHGFPSFPNPSLAEVPPAGDIAVRGTMVCLPHRDTSGPQTDECAFGIKDDTGRYFALSDSDPEYQNISGLAMNLRIEISGYFTPRSDSRYQDIGIITVTSVREVQESGTTTPGGGEGIAPYTSGVRGTVLFGPACPVMKDPLEEQCADKPYATLVAIFRADDPVHAYVLTKSDAEGAFEASLPPGDYSIGAGESMLPQCEHVGITVLPSVYASTTISCDTGIR